MATEQRRQYQREWVAARRASYISKRGGKCEVCEATDKLEFDHIDRSTKVSHRMFSWSHPRIEAELSKCTLLCHDCHWKKTREDLGYLKENHGTVTQYRKGCRCLLCKQAKAASR